MTTPEHSEREAQRRRLKMMLWMVIIAPPVLALAGLALYALDVPPFRDIVWGAAALLVIWPGAILAMKHSIRRSGIFDETPR